MPKTEYNSNSTPSNDRGTIPLFKRPYDGGRITRLEDDVDAIFGRLDGLEGRFDGFDERLEDILRACRGKESSKNEDVKAAVAKGVATPPPPPPVTPEVKQVAANVDAKTAVQSQSASEPVAQPQPQPAPTKNGWPRVGYAYIWWDAQNRVWVPCTNIWAAKQAGNGVYHPKWAWLDEQHRLVRFLTKEEIVRYCP